MDYKPKIVRLDGIYTRFDPTFNLPHDYTEYPFTIPAETDSRIAGADIVITTRAPLDESNVSRWAATHSRPKMIAVMAIGTDMLDLATCRKLGVFISNVPAASNESVAEQAIALYFAAKRKVIRMHDCVVQDLVWRQTGTSVNAFGALPGTARTDILGIVGAGELGMYLALDISFASCIRGAILCSKS
jgi:glycerate dehydrogenase